MHFSLLFTLLPALAASSPLQSRQDILPTGQTVKQDVLNIHYAVRELDQIIQTYKGSRLPTSIVEGTPVLLGVAKIHEVNRAGFRHALEATPFTLEDSIQVIDTVVETGMQPIPSPLMTSPHKAVFPTRATRRALAFCFSLVGISSLTTNQVNVSIPEATQHLKDKMLQFKEGGLAPVVVASLALLLTDHDTFSGATLLKTNPKLDEEKKKEGTDAVANIHNAIWDAIRFYSENIL